MRSILTKVASGQCDVICSPVFAEIRSYYSIRLLDKSNRLIISLVLCVAVLYYVTRK